MKKIILFGILFLLCLSSYSLTKEQYEKIVDYVAIKYANKYAVQYSQVNINGSDIKLYNDSVKPKIQNINSIEKCASSKDFITLLKNNKWNTLASNVEALIKKQTKDYSINNKNKEIADLVNALTKDYVDKLKIENEDNQEILNAVKDYIGENNNTQNVKIVNTSDAHSNSSSTLQDNKDWPKWIKISATVIVWFLIGFIVFLFIKLNETKSKYYDYKEKYEKQQRELINNKRKVDDLTVENGKLKSDNSTYLDQLKSAINHNEQKNHNEPINPTPSAEKPVPASQSQPTPITENPKVLYASTIDTANRVFYNVSDVWNNEAVYSLKLEGQDQASFDIDSRAHKKVLMRQEFIDGCKLKRMSSNPTNVSCENLGQAQRNTDGKWEVIDYPSVKFS